jgi:thiamine-phosphate pyrophosphorylase
MSREDLRLLLVTDGTGDVERILSVSRAAREGGARAVQLREPGLAGKALLDLAEALRGVFPAGDGTVVVNDRADVALAAGADGVHLGFRSIPVPEARRLFRSGTIGVSVHDPQEARRAIEEGADYLVFGPVFETPSKRGKLEPRGLAALSEVAKASPVPVLAIGGIDASRARRCAEAGAFGVACIRALFARGDPRGAARAILEAMTGAGAS